MMGVDGRSFGHKRRVNHKKFGVLAEMFLFVPPALGRPGRSEWQVAQSGYA